MFNWLRKKLNPKYPMFRLETENGVMTGGLEYLPAMQKMLDDCVPPIKYTVTYYNE